MLLIAGEKTFLAKKGEKIHTHFGVIDTSRAKIGRKIKSSLGHEFMVLEASVVDILKKCKRGPQIIMPKDAAQIIAVTGACSGWNCLDAGGGSGFLSIFLANIVNPGKVTVYEKEKSFFELIKHNVKLCGMENIQVKNKDILKGFSEKNLDIITLDMRYAEKLVAKAYKALKPGRWLCVYSPHIEQQKKAVEKMKIFSDVRTVETIQREWQVNNYKGGYTHPRPSGILHTGFMTFGRKVK